MDAFGKGVGRGGAPEPADILRWPPKVSPSGVVYCPACHPSHCGGIPPSRGGFVEIFHPGPFQGRHHRSLISIYHPPARQAGRSGYSKPESVRLRELDILMCCHRTPGCRFLQADRF